MANKVSGWKEKLLTPAGKEILIKSVAQAVPSYTMSCFLLPKKLCEELTGMIRQFWWGQVKNEKKLAWLSWDKMCLPKERGGLGFRDLTCFNLALLAKQGWRLQTNPTSLFSRVYKAKYFPQCSFVEAKLGSNPSYAWQSLMAAQGVVRRGMRWQVGNGNKIRVWQDKWIPRPSTYRLVTPEKLNSENALVCELINRATHEWNTDRLQEWFLPEDREAIMSIPLSANEVGDRLIWAENRSGKFTVKSAYALALEEQSRLGLVDCSNGSVRRKLWKTIWQLKLPQKLKHFAWKASHDILAIKMSLAVRKIVPNGVCDFCGQDKETVTHLLWFCSHATEVWTASKLVLPFEIAKNWSFLDVVEHLKRCEETWPNLLDRVIAICWGIWKNMNELWTGGKGKTGRTILRTAMNLLDEFRTANEPKDEPVAAIAPTVSWQPPSDGCYKVNMDRAVFSNRKQAGAGVIIRDGAGEVVAALSKKWNYPLGAIEAEAKAMEAGITFAHDVGIRDAEVETDSLEIFNALRGHSAPPSLVVNVVTGILKQASFFRKWKFTHTKRQGNVPAHVLAQHAKNVEDYLAWVEECPSVVEHVCAQDRL